MKHIIFTGVLVLASAIAGEAMADCSTNQVTNTSAVLNLTNLLTNHTVCQAAGAGEPHGAQEEHVSGGVLNDFKKGFSSQIDPPTQIGHWSVTGTDADTVVNYTYLGGGGSGTYKVFDNGGGSYDFCNGTAQVATVTVVTAINTGCPGFTHGAP